MKSALKIGISVIVGLIVGSAVTDHFWRSYVGTLRDAQEFALTVGAERRAESAYFEKSPEIAELELTRLLPHLDLSPSPVHNDQREQAFKRFVATARLAKVQRAQGKQPDADQNFQTALSLIHTFFPDSKAASADDVLAALATIDNAAKKNE